MHLNKLLEQIKRHQSPTEAIDKLATALEKHERCNQYIIY